MKISALVPLKLKSRRLPNKNFLRLGDRPLSYHIFDTLTKIDLLQNIYCYTSQPQVLSLLPEKIELLMRPKRLDADSIKANELFKYAIENIDSEYILICHATGPYIKEESIEKGILAIESGEYDCAFSVEKIQTYAWYDNKPLNYNPENMAQTQDLIPVFAETSGFYIFRKDDYLKNNTRIGKKPFFVEVGIKEAIDIDEPKDLSLATQLYDYEEYEQNYSTDPFFVNIANENIEFSSIKHISFDLDGVLINSLPVMDKAWAAAMDETNQQILFEEYKKYIGIPFYDILKKVSCDNSLYEKVDQVYNDVSVKSLNDIEVYEGTVKMLLKAKEHGVLVSVVTSKNATRTKSILENYFSEVDFDVVITPEDVEKGRGKPNPDPILLACIKLGIDPSNTIYVGDMDADREASHRAGTHFIHAAWGFSELEHVKDMWFNNIEDMMENILGL